ncbi:hypothetical protein DP590_07440 [Salmonella enterica]|nr:hypothetical protein [Salmonella enterica]ECE0739835.1 hypothetical protein [Salmonella enterica subsp. enterica serovar Hvittingfoss]HEC8061815.1 hypothetical protein [Salmonella enterica subsp. enterica serovar Potsdam]EGA8118259.1 hypothetical protein [Salmonella enterica]EHO8673538.1 hypothetical protein [Salmonella enterica]
MNKKTVKNYRSAGIPDFTPGEFKTNATHYIQCQIKLLQSCSSVITNNNRENISKTSTDL